MFIDKQYSYSLYSSNLVCNHMCYSIHCFLFMQQYYCRYQPSNVGAVVRGIVTISRGSEPDLESALATAGPIAVYVDASHSAFQV